MPKQYLSAFTKVPVLAIALFIALAIPLLSLPEITKADLNNTRADAWGTDELAGSSASNLGGQGVDVYSNGSSSAPHSPEVDNSVNGVNTGAEWQCVELINRLYAAKGWITTQWKGNGSTLINNLPAGTTEQVYNAVTSVNPGDVITFSDTLNGPGHVVYVSSVSGNTVNVVSQNTQGVLWSLTWSGTTLSQTYLGSFYNVQAIVHAPAVSQYHYIPLAADFSGDGLADIGLYDRNIGMFYIKHGPSFSDQISYQWAAGANYQPVAADFNHDGFADIGLRDVNTGVIYIKHGPSFGDQVTYQWAAGANYQVLAADFNGDGYADIGLRDMNTGTFYIKHGPGFSDQITYQWVAGANYQPVAADFNGDGYADIGLYDQNIGMFYIKHGPSFSDQITYQWAAGANYQPLAADFNGDSDADIGLRDANIGMFYIKHGTSFSDQLTYQWAGG